MYEVGLTSKYWRFLKYFLCRSWRRERERESGQIAQVGSNCNGAHESLQRIESITPVTDLVTCCLEGSRYLVIGLPCAIHERVFCRRLWETLSCYKKDLSLSLFLSLSRCMPHYACLGDLCGRITFSFYSRDWCFPLQEEAYTTSCSLCPDSPTASGYGFPACIRWLLGGGSNHVLGFFLPLCYLQKVYKSLGLIVSFFYISPSLSRVHVSCALVFLSV